MVCSRCKMVVKSVFKNIGIPTIAVELGKIELGNDLSEDQKHLLIKKLHSLGFDLIDDKKIITVDKIKTLIINLVQNKNTDLKTNLSDYLVRQIHQDYSILSNLFSEVENITIEKYFINQKIEKVKELISCNELSMSQIAYTLNYSSVSHFSNQFKKTTGFSPTYFKNLRSNKRTQIEDL